MLAAIHRRRRRQARPSVPSVKAMSLALVGATCLSAACDRLPDKHVHAQSTATVIRRAARAWQAENPRRCPTLSLLRKQRHLDSAVASADPWGGDFHIECHDADIRVRSPGKDGRIGTDDDIKVPQQLGAAPYAQL